MLFGGRLLAIISLFCIKSTFKNSRSAAYRQLPPSYNPQKPPDCSRSPAKSKAQPFGFGTKKMTNSRHFFCPQPCFLPPSGWKERRFWGLHCVGVALAVVVPASLEKCAARQKDWGFPAWGCNLRASFALFPACCALLFSFLCAFFFAFCVFFCIMQVWGLVGFSSFFRLGVFVVSACLPSLSSVSRSACS